MSRIAVCAVLCAASCLLVAQRAEPAGAQDKKAKAATLEQQVAALKQELQEAAKVNTALKQDIVQGEKQLAALKTANAKLEAQAKDDKSMKALQATIDGYRGAGLVHVVILKLKADSSSGEAQSVIDETYSQLSKIKTVRGVWAGKPVAKATTTTSSTTTTDAGSDYTVALVFVFDDAAGLKSYLNDPVHTKFADKHLKLWETPVVYDFEPKKPMP